MKDVYLIKKALKRRLYYFFYWHFFGSIGYKSFFDKAIRVSGKKYIFLKKGVNFNEGARVEAIASWNGKKFSPKLIVGDNCSFEQSAHITFASNLTIGNNCVFSSRVMITTIDHVYEKIGVSVLKQDISTKDVTIGNNCFVGMDVKIFPGVTIGNNVIIGANTIVTHDIPSYSVCVGVPARVIKTYDFGEGKWKKL